MKMVFPLMLLMSVLNISCANNYSAMIERIPGLNTALRNLKVDIWEISGEDQLSGKYQNKIITFSERIIFAKPLLVDKEEGRYCESKFYTFHYHQDTKLLEFLDPYHQGYTGVVRTSATDDQHDCRNTELENYSYIER